MNFEKLLAELSECVKIARSDACVYDKENALHRFRNRLLQLRDWADEETQKLTKEKTEKTNG